VKRRTILAVALGASGALAACNFIVDAGSYSVGNTGGSDASTDGTSTLDTGVAPGDSSSLVDSPAVSDSGVAVDTGSVVDTGAPPGDGAVTCGQGLPTTSPSFTKLVNACALAVGCSPGGFEVNMSNCITEDFVDAVPALGCLDSITSCAGFEACRGAAVPSKTECPTAQTAPHCTDAGVGVNCGGSLYIPIDLDCPALGGTCAVYATDAGTAADCKVVSSCTMTNPSNQFCKSNNLYSCIDGVGYGQSCGADQTCYEDPTNGTSCYFNSSACVYSGVDTYVCNGNVVDWCTSIDNNGALFPFDCSTAGLSCNSNSDGNGNAGCLAPGCTASDVSNCTESCSGSKATVCVGGAPYTFDCTTIGATGTFTTCSVLTDTNQNQYAACQ
jgi:hypothetical protein